MDIWFGTKPPIEIAQTALTIGNFDGVHRGHLHILQRLKQEADARKLRSVAMIFEPQPPEFFQRAQTHNRPFRITPLRDKLRLLKQTACLDAVWVQRFNASFADLSAQDFIKNILLEQLHTRYLLIGDDFRFGKGRGGDFTLLSQQTDFITENTPSILVADRRASSTAVREALRDGRLDVAKQILGHDYVLSGRVKHGAKLGRTIGCPTANIHLPAYHYALQGIFVVSVSDPSGQLGSEHKFGVASFGVNPTVSHNLQTKLEVHLFDFSGDLYGKRLEIAFLHKLRDEQKFTSLEALTQQIQLDIIQARNWLKLS